MTPEEAKVLTEEQLQSLPVAPYLMREYEEGVRELLEMGVLERWLECPPVERSAEENIELIRTIHMMAVNALKLAMYDMAGDEQLAVLSRILLDVGTLY